MHQNDLSLPDFKSVVSNYLIGRYTSQIRAPPEGKADTGRKYQYWFEHVNLPLHLPQFQNIRG